MNDSNANAPKSSRDPNEADANPSWCDQDGCVELLCAFDQALLEGLGPPKTLDAASAADPTVAAQLSGARQIIAGLALLGQLDSGPAAEFLPSRQRPAAVNIPARRTPVAAADAEDATSLPTGHQIGRFAVIRELGRGGLGVVFLAHDPLLVRDVALKIPRPEALFTADLRRRFAREAQAAARLTHPNLVAVYEVGTTGPVNYIAAAYCPGPNLAKWLADRTDPVPIAVAAEIVAQLADGIDYAHGQGVLHRDLKPSNVMLEQCGAGAAAETASLTKIAALPFVPKITDFGLARVEDLTADETRTGLVVGTPGYMAPEQAEGRTRDLGPATDVYGLGAILYELLVGKPVFRGAHDLDTLRRMIAEEPVRPRRGRPDLPRDLEAICLKCLEKHPPRRYPSAGRLAADLRRFLAGEPTLARPIGSLARAGRWTRRRPAASALLAVTVLAATSLVIGSLWYSARLTTAYQLAEQHQQEAEDRRLEAESQRAEADTQRNQADMQRREAEARRAEALSLVSDLRREVYVKDVGRALQTWEQGDASRAIALLDKYRSKAGEEDLRGFEWFYLKRVFNDQGRTVFGHLGAVHHVAASPDGTLVATAGRDRTVQIWDTRQWKIRATLSGHKSDVNWVAFAPDGAHVASASDDGSVRLWEIATGRARTLAKYDDGVTAVVFRLDGQSLIVSTKYGHIARLDAESGIAQWSLDRPRNVKSLVLSPDGKELAVSFDFQGSETEQWDLMTSPPTLLSDAPATRMGQLESGYVLQYSRDGQTLVAGTTTGLLVIFSRNGATAEPRSTQQLWSKTLDCIAMAPDGQTLAAAGGDGVIRLVDLATGRDLQSFVGHRDRVRSLAWLPDGGTLVSASEDGTVKLWSPRQSTQAPAVFELPNANDPPSSARVCRPHLKFSTDGRQIWTNTVDDIWNVDLASRQVTRRLPISPTIGGFSDISYALEPGHERALICSDSGARQVWDVSADRVIFSVSLDVEEFRRCKEAFGGARNYLADLSGDGKQVVAPDLSGDVTIWSVDTGQPLLRLSKHYETPIVWVRYSPDARWVVVGAAESVVDIFDAATGAQWTTLKNSTPPVFSPDSRFFIQEMIGRNDTYRIVRTDQLRPIGRDLQLPTTRESPMAVTHDGKTFATIRPYGTHVELCLWNIAAGQPMVVIGRNLIENVVAAAFSPDDSVLVTLGHFTDRWIVRVWRAGARDAAVAIDEHPIAAGPP